MWKKWKPYILLVQLYIGAVAMKTVWRFLKKLKTVLTHDPSVSLLDIYPKKTKTLFQKHICTPMYVFTAALFTIDKIWRQPVSVDR